MANEQTEFYSSQKNTFLRYNFQTHAHTQNCNTYTQNTYKLLTYATIDVEFRYCIHVYSINIYIHKFKIHM